MRGPSLVTVSLRVLLGGGIGSGKSLVGRRLSDSGAVVVETDRIGHAAIAPGGAAFESVSRRWPSVVTRCGIDRTALGRIVFGDAEQLRELEGLVHPHVVAEVRALAQRDGDLVVEMPIILDVPGAWTKVFIDAPRQLRLRRAIDRGFDEDDVLRRAKEQPTRGEWSAWADATISNDGSIDELNERVDDFWRAASDR